MNTPYQIFRTKNKLRKQQLNRNINQIDPQLAIGAAERVKTTEKQSSSRKTSFGKRIRSTRSENNKFRINKLKLEPEDQYQVVIKNANKKSSQVEFTLSKSGQPKTQRSTSREKIGSKKNLHITGTYCGRDLIKLNRKKLEDLISKIQGNELKTIGSQPIPEMIVKKCKDLKQKMDKREDHPHSKSPMLPRHKLFDLQQIKHGHSTNWQEMASDSSMYIQSIPQKFDAKQFLKCFQLNKKPQEDQENNNSFEFVLNNSKITNFIRQSKKKSNQRRSKLYEECEPIQQNTPVFSSRQVLNFQTSKKKSTMKSHSPRRMNESFKGKSSSNKAKINGINFRNLDGWEAEQGNPEVNFMNPSLLY